MVVIFTACNLVVYSQGTTCASASPFCSQSGITYPAGVNNGNAPSGNNYGCLSSTPNPAWFFFEIENGGYLQITLSSSPPRDIDFILYGPFPNLSTALASCGSLGTGNSTQNGIIDCSFSIGTTELVDIPNAQSGQVYILMVTNFSNQATTISFTNSSPSGSMASTNCEVLCNLNVTGNVTNASCGLATGSIQLNVVGGSGSNAFIWNTGATTSTLSGLVPGSYTVTVTDQNNTSCTAVETFNIGSNPPPQLNGTVTQTTCGLPNGSIQLSATGLVGAPVFSWSPPLGGTSATQNLLSPGTYTATVTDASTGCTATQSFTIDPSNNIQVDAVVTPTTCGNSNGSAQISVIGGSGNYTYGWSPAGPSGANPTNLAPNTYVVVVTDQTSGCSETSTVTIDASTGIEIVVSKVDTRCDLDNGSIDLQTIPTNAAINYVWSPASLNGLQSPSGLASGFYTVTVTDANGCTDTETIEILESAPLEVVADIDPPSCGLATGSIEISVLNAVGAPFFVWQPATITGSLAQNLPAGQYAVTVTDPTIPGCESILNFNLQDEDNLIIEVNATATSCGLSNGSIVIDVLSGIGNFIVQWPLGLQGNGLTQQNLSVGSYSFTVIDQGTGCTETQIVEILPSDPILVDWIVSSTTCGLNNGSIQVNVNGGSGDYDYSWADIGMGGSVRVNLSPGIYTVTVEDNATGCQAISVIEVTGSDPLFVTSSVGHTSCQLSNGSISITGLNSTGSIIVDWNGLNTSSPTTAIQVAAGSYTFDVTDSSTGCSTAITVQVNPSEPIQVSFTTTPPFCGNANGTIALNPTGGSGSYSYSWSNGNSSSIGSNLTSGTYQVTVTDVQDPNCLSIIVITLEDDSPFDYTFEVVPTRCGESNGALTIVTSGSLGPFVFIDSQGNTSANLSFNNLPSGFFQGTIIDQSTSCEVNINVLIEPSEPIELSSTIEHTTCGLDNGGVQVDVFAGSGSYSYIWGEVAGGSNTLQWLPSGTYTVTVEDQIFGCIAFGTFEVDDSESLEIEYVVDPTRCDLANGNISLLPINGSGDFVYNFFFYGSNTTGLLSGIPAGIYPVEVTDNVTGCLFFDQVEIVSSDPLEVDVELINNTCDNSSGVISMHPIGGSGNYQYVWAAFPGYTDSSRSGLANGTYFITVTDLDYDCEVPVVATIVGSDNLTFTASVVHTTCGLDNGSIQVSMNNQQLSFAFDWSHISGSVSDIFDLEAGVYALTITSIEDNCFVETVFEIIGSSALSGDVVVVPTSCGLDNGSILLSAMNGSGVYQYTWVHDPNLHSQAATDLSGGQYYIWVVNDVVNGCSWTDSAEINTSLPLWVSAEVHPLVCIDFTGSIALDVQDGSGNYTFMWDGFPGIDTSHLGGLTSGIYSYRVEDLTTGCAFSGVGSIDNLDVLQLVVEVIQHETQKGLRDGIVSVTWQGGISNYELIYFFDQDSITFALDSIGNLRIEGLAPGLYTWAIRDADGCELTIVVEILEGDCLFQVLVNAEDLTCHGDNSGAIRLEFLNIVGEVDVQWPAFTTYDSIGVDFVTGLPAGMYQFSVTDESGCDQQVQITISEPAPISLSCSAIHESAVGQQDGQIQILFSGNRGVTIISTTIPGFEIYEPQPDETAWSIQDVPPGTYQILLQDEWNCTATCQVVVRPANCDMQISNLDLMHPLCHGGQGGISIGIIDPSGDVSLIWSDIGTFNSLIREDIAAGLYSVIITDEVGCQRDTSFTLIQPTPLEIAIESKINPACGRNDGSVTIMASGGTGLLTAAWSNGMQGFELAGIQSGTYTVTVTDANGCGMDLEVDFEEILGPTIEVVDLVDNLCHGDFEGSILVQVLDGTAPFSYNWSNGLQNEAQLSDLSAGDYELVVIDLRNCSDTLWFTISEAEPILPGLEVVPPDCDQTNGMILFSPSGGTAPYQVYDAAGQSSTQFINLGEGTYTYRIVDASACERVETVTITARNRPLCSAGEDQSLRCNQREVMLVGIMDDQVINQLSYCWINAITGDTLNHQQDQLIVSESGVFLFYVFDRLSGCFNVDSVEVRDSIYEITFVDVQWGDPSCPDDENGYLQLMEVEGGTGPYAILLNQSPISERVDNLGAGTYLVSITDYYGCVWPDIEIVLQNPVPPVIQLPDRIEPVKGRAISIIPIIQWADPIITLNWYQGTDLICSSCSDPTLTMVFEDTTYLTLEIINERGCVFRRSVWIYPMDDLAVFIPNSFSPNGDGINDRFFLFDAAGISRILSFEVFDRWGSRVFQKRDLSPRGEDQGWDGTFKGMDLMPDHFIYYIEVLFHNGNTLMFYGGVQLIR